ncbi:MAG: Rieske (2Fe-2S) protein [Bacteroidales bacterium]|nr:Rieske (2Fe-2S) protein [Bacteroidales bacterium]
MSRKNFLRLLNALTITFFLYIWHLLVKNSDSSDYSGHRKKISLPLNEGVTFFDTFYVHVAGQSVKAYSTRCTHAGCKINKEINGQIICPCHGSHYDSATGKVLKGPAQLPLMEFSCSFDSGLKQWVIIEKAESTL